MAYISMILNSLQSRKDSKNRRQLIKSHPMLGSWKHWMPVLCWLSPFIQSPTPVQRIHILKAFPLQLNPSENTVRYTQRCIFMVIISSIMLTIKINHIPLPLNHKEKCTIITRDIEVHTDKIKFVQSYLNEFRPSHIFLMFFANNQIALLKVIIHFQTHKVLLTTSKFRRMWCLQHFIEN